MWGSCTVDDMGLSLSLNDSLFIDRKQCRRGYRAIPHRAYRICRAMLPAFPPQSYGEGDGTGGRAIQRVPFSVSCHVWGEESSLYDIIGPFSNLKNSNITKWPHQECGCAQTIINLTFSALIYKWINGQIQSDSKASLSWVMRDVVQSNEGYFIHFLNSLPRVDVEKKSQNFAGFLLSIL